MNNTEEITRNADLVSLVEKAGGQPKKSNSEWRSFCPLHGGHNPTSFAIYNESGKQYWKCFTRAECGGGDAIDFVMKWQGIQFLQAIEYLGGGRQIDRAEMAKFAAERAERAARELENQIARAQTTLAELRQAQNWIYYHDQLDQNEEYRQLWNVRGVPDVWQDLWYLGYAPCFTASTPMGLWKTPTLSIPIFAEGNATDPVSLRHRLLNPPAPGDKYRPERPGLKAAPFVADPENKPDNVLVVEGEIKAMVSYITLDSTKWQVMGIPGKRIFHDLIPQLRGRQVVVCLDPDALPEAEEMARAVSGRVLEIQFKIDDAINAGMIDKDMLRQLIRASRKVRSA
jgi:hypothetical protein